jgi:hypothetical protein
MIGPHLALGRQVRAERCRFVLRRILGMHESVVPPDQ